MNERNRQKAWRERVKAKGFKQLYMNVPNELAELLKQLAREWKAKNPQHYERI